MQKYSKKHSSWQVIDENELHFIIDAIIKGKDIPRCKYKKFIRIRNAFMIYLAYTLGLRPKECRCIKLSDIRRQKLYIPADNNKQRNNDVIPLPDIIFYKIQIYITALKEFFDNPIYLFPKRDNEPIDRGSHIRFFREASRRAGFPGLTLYSLRHSFGTNAYLRFHDIPKVGVLIRHYDFQYRTTLRYIHTASPIMREELLNELYN